MPPKSNPDGTSALELEADESRDFAVAMARIAHETKGSDIMVLHVAPLIYWTSYMVSKARRAVTGVQMAAVYF